MEKEILPLLFGGDINVYSVARAFHEAYGIKSVAYGKYHTFPCAYSDILDYRTCKDNDKRDVFLENVKTVSAEFPNHTIILLGCGDNYLQLASGCIGAYPENVIAPYIDIDLMNRLIDKAQFYALCDEYGLDHPDTFIYRKEMGDDFALPFSFPCVAKPADGVSYWDYPFEGMKKAFVCQDRAELLSALHGAYGAGYSAPMIIQDFIPGDDTYMRVLTNYSDRAGKVKMMCLGHVLLEEHSPNGIGNHAVIITEQEPQLCEKIQAFLEKIGYVGFSNFDIKYDSRDGKYKLFEINCRQGRSNYYVTGAGMNIAQYLVKDLIEHAPLPLSICSETALWRMIPRRLALRFVPKQYHAQMKTLMRQGKDSHSLCYPADHGKQRWWRVLKNHVGNWHRFLKHNKKPN